MLPKEWTGNLVGLMHNHRITSTRLADKLGVTNRYVSMVLNGHRNPVGAQARFESAVLELIAEAQSCSDDSTEDVP
ncbi:MAG: helix-turn-helix transcriptional regulator [Bacteroidaceae bacterium]|nr:helix-turn-helix transcriptional regulator [Bacteroidaceae bacterium]